MLISLNWVREHCPFQTREKPLRIGERFSLSTAEVEGVRVRGAGLRRIVAARIEELKAIPGADRLVEARVEAGTGSPVAVVCGAPNARAGLCAPFAAPGTAIGGRKISARPIHGVVSAGMLLSEAELEISPDHAELLELPPETPPGTPLDRLFPDLLDVVLEIENKSLTHRPDLWGHYGMAREFAVIYGTPVKPYPVDESLVRGSSLIEESASEIKVTIDQGLAAERCRRYCGLRIDGVKVGPSPDWLRRRLHTIGSRPINNIVDITNYILFDLGQPLHAFDREKIRGGRIIARMAREGETMRLLDGRSAPLASEDLVIADAEGPVALAGVMGGEGSEIGDSTTSIFLESANFEAAGVRRSSIRHGRTESSARFEKSLDPHQARLGILRAARLVLDLCPGARVVGSLQDAGFRAPVPIVIELAPRFIPERLGARISPKRMRGILDGLGFRVEEGAREESGGARRRRPEKIWRVTVPSWRATRDVSNREDLVEEVGRLHGYGKITPFAPVWPVAPPAVNERRRFERRVKNHLAVHGGLSEVFTYSCVGAAHCRSFGLDPGDHLALKNALSEDMDRLRREIVPIHLEKARDNQRFSDRFGIFEVGRVYLKERGRLRDPELPRENTRIAGVLAFPEKTPENFHRLRHLVLSLAESLQVAGAEVRPLERDRSWIHPAVGARLVAGGAEAGSFFRIHPDTARRLELEGDVLAFDLDFDRLFEAPGREVLYRRLPRFPAVPFDVAVVAPERVQAAEIAARIRAAAGARLEDLEVFDVYQGAGIPPGMKSIAFHMTFRAEDHTLTAQEKEEIEAAVIAALEKAGFPLRA